MDWSLDLDQDLDQDLDLDQGADLELDNIFCIIEGWIVTSLNLDTLVLSFPLNMRASLLLVAFFLGTTSASHVFDLFSTYCNI